MHSPQTPHNGDVVVVATHTTGHCSKTPAPNHRHTVLIFTPARNTPRRKATRCTVYRHIHTPHRPSREDNPAVIILQSHPAQRKVPQRLRVAAEANKQPRRRVAVPVPPPHTLTLTPRAHSVPPQRVRHRVAAAQPQQHVAQPVQTEPAH
eukprot:3346148-Rhodomonas_salina.1